VGSGAKGCNEARKTFVKQTLNNDVSPKQIKSSEFLLQIYTFLVLGSSSSGLHILGWSPRLNYTLLNTPWKQNSRKLSESVYTHCAEKTREKLYFYCNRDVE